MTKRIFRSIFLVAAITLFALLAIIFGILYDYFQGQLFNELKNQAALISRSVEREGLDYFDGFGGVQNRITLIDADGSVLYDTDANVSSLENHADREEIISAFETGSGQSTRYSATISKVTLYYALRLNNGSILRVAATQNSIWMVLLAMFQPIVVVLIVVLIAAAVAAKNVSKRITSPVNNIDPENPELNDVYEELSPLVRKLKYQNHVIKSQMELLQTKQREFSQITENMQEGFLVIDKNTELLSYNSGALKILGADKKPEGSVLTLNRSETLRTSVERALSGEHVTRSISISGRCYQLIANPVVENSEIAGAIIVLMDVTEKEERESLRREFTANVSHELRTPLTAISGTAEVIKNGLIRPEDIPHFAGNIYDEAQRLISLISDIIRLSKLDESDSSDKKTEPVELYGLCADIAKRLSAAAAQKNVSLELAGSNVVINAERSMVDEIVFNLADNAVKYNKEGGHVIITVSDYPASICVEDTGIGIPASQQDRVFERFYRVDKSHSKKIGGTGLGLSIVKHAAAYLGAKVVLESREGEGTRVTVSF